VAWFQHSRLLLASQKDASERDWSFLKETKNHGRPSNAGGATFEIFLQDLSRVGRLARAEPLFLDFVKKSS
jgi:hypothetical protein